MSFRFLSIFALIFSVTLFAAEARRGFSSGGSGSGSYDSSAPTASWDLSSTPDADCLAVYNSACASLTPAQVEEVTRLTADAQAANYTNHSDYLTANVFGYGLTSDDGTQWTDAKSPGADNSGTDSAWNTDCDAAFSSTGGCDAITETQFSSIDDATSGRVPALAAGYDSYDAWQTASDLGYEMTSADATLWGEANNGSVSAAACDAEFPGRTCNQLTKASFENAKSANALITAKIAKVNAGTLTSADLLSDLSLSVSNSALTSPISAWQLDYLETVLGTSNSTTKDDWQSTIDAYDSSAASAWYIWKIASSTASSGTYAASNATAALFNAAGASSAVTTLSVTNAQIAADIRSSGFSAAPSATQMNNFLTEARGFADGTTYASVATATGNNWSIANFITATTNGGWTSSSADEASFDECLASTDDASGGGSTCSVSKSGWTAIDAIASVADGDATLTASNVTSILTATGATANASFSSSNSKHIDYLQSCASGDDAAQAVADCASSSSFLANATGFEIGKAVADNSGSYTLASVVTTGNLTSVGVPSNSLNVIGANYCGSNGTSSCLSRLRTRLLASNLTASSTPAQVRSKINELMRDEMVSVVASTTELPAVPSDTSMTVGCSGQTAKTLPLPVMCGHGQWTCSVETGPSSWSVNSSSQLVVPASFSTAGNQTVTIRMSLGIYSPAYTKDVSRTYNLQTAFADGVSYRTISYANVVGAANACSNLGGRIFTCGETTSDSNLSSQVLCYPSDSTPSWNTQVYSWNSSILRTSSQSCAHNKSYGYHHAQSQNGSRSCAGSSGTSTWNYGCTGLPQC